MVSPVIDDAITVGRSLKIGAGKWGRTFPLRTSIASTNQLELFQPPTVDVIRLYDTPARLLFGTAVLGTAVSSTVHY